MNNLFRNFLGQYIDLNSIVYANLSTIYYYDKEKDEVIVNYEYNPYYMPIATIPNINPHNIEYVIFLGEGSFDKDEAQKQLDEVMNRVKPYKFNKEFVPMEAYNKLLELGYMGTLDELLSFPIEERNRILRAYLK